MRTQRSILTFLAGEIFAGVTIITGLLATPPLLRWLGDERFGAFRVTTDWYGYVALFELGLGGALLPLLAQANGRRNVELVRQTLVAGMRAYWRLTLVMLAGGLGLAATITWLVPVSAANAPDLRRACIIALLSIAFVPLAPFRALVEARQRGYRMNVLRLLQSLLVTALSLAVAWAGWGISGQCLAVAVAGVGFRLVLAWEARLEFPGVFAASIRQVPDSEVWRRLWDLNWPTLIFNIAGRVSLLTDNIIVARLLGAASVVPFFVTQRLASLAQRELQGIGNASWAALAELHAQDQVKLFNRRLIELTSLVTVLGVAGVVPLAAYNRHFVTLWVGPARYAGGFLTIIASVNAFMLAIFSLWGWCVSGTGKIAEMSNAMVIQAIINVTLSIVLTRHLGCVGPVLGTLISFIAVSAWYLPKLLKQLFGVSLIELIGAIAGPLELGLPYAALIWWAAEMHDSGGLFKTASEIILAALLYVTGWWLLILKRPERADWSRRLRMLSHQIAVN